MDSAKFVKMTHVRTIFRSPLHQMFRAISEYCLRNSCRETLGERDGERGQHGAVQLGRLADPKKDARQEALPRIRFLQVCPKWGTYYFPFSKQYRFFSPRINSWLPLMAGVASSGSPRLVWCATSNLVPCFSTTTSPSRPQT